MHTPICDRLGCDVPIFAFSHCRDVVAAVTRAGGFGVLGASTYSPEQFATELAWIDSHTDGRPYGIDVIVPTVYDRDAEANPEDLEGMIPEEHREFMDKILAEAGVPELSDDERARLRRELAAGRGGMTPDGARRLVSIALEHPQVTMVVSALGAPPPDVVEQLKERGIAMGALCGKARHADLQHDQRLVVCCRRACRRHKPAGVADGFQKHRHGPDLRVGCQPGGECTTAEIGLISGGHDVTERDVLLIGQAGQKERGRSALRHESDAILARRGRYRGGPRHRLRDEVHESQAVRAEEPDSRCSGAVSELLLPGLTLRADFGEA